MLPGLGTSVRGVAREPTPVMYAIRALLYSALWVHSRPTSWFGLRLIITGTPGASSVVSRWALQRPSGRWIDVHLSSQHLSVGSRLLFFAGQGWDARGLSLSLLRASVKAGSQVLLLASGRSVTAVYLVPCAGSFPSNGLIAISCGVGGATSASPRQPQWVGPMPGCGLGWRARLDDPLFYIQDRT